MVPLPAALGRLVAGATWAQIILGESGAEVYRLHAGSVWKRTLCWGEARLVQ